MSGRGGTLERWVAAGMGGRQGREKSILVEGLLFSNRQGLGEMWTDKGSLVGEGSM